MLAERTTAPAAIVSVFRAATMIRARSGRPSESAPRRKSQPCWRLKGGMLRPRRFCLAAASLSSAGPKIAQRSMIRRKITAAVANLSRQSMPRTIWSRPLAWGTAMERLVVIGFASSVVGRGMGSRADPGIEHGIGKVDQEVHDEDRDRGDHDGGEDHVEVA